MIPLPIVIGHLPAEPDPQFGACFERVQIDALVLQRRSKPLRKNTLSIQRSRPSILSRTLASRNASAESAPLDWNHPPGFLAEPRSIVILPVSARVRADFKVPNGCATRPLRVREDDHVTPPASRLTNGSLLRLVAQKRTGRNPEEFRMPAGVRKSWKPEPGGRRRCAMRFSVFGLLRRLATRRTRARAWMRPGHFQVGVTGSPARVARLRLL